MRRDASGRDRDNTVARRGHALGVVALALSAGSALAACGDPATDGAAAAEAATTTRAWNDVAGLGTSSSLTTTGASAPTPATGSLVPDTADVRIVWSLPADGAEFIAVHDGVVYITTDVEVLAASLADGTVLWRHTSVDKDYFSDGESRVAMDGDELWVVAPYNTNIHLDPATGRTIRVDALTESAFPDGFTSLPTPSPNGWTVTNTLGGARAVLPDGRPAWHLVVEDDGYAAGGPVVAEGDVTLVPATDGHVYAISAP